MLTVSTAGSWTSQWLRVHKEVLEPLSALTAAHVYKWYNPGSYPASETCPGVTVQAKLTMAERRALMDSFVRDGWLISTPGAAGRYSIGVRNMLCLVAITRRVTMVRVCGAQVSLKSLLFACSASLEL